MDAINNNRSANIITLCKICRLEVAGIVQHDRHTHLGMIVEASNLLKVEPIGMWN